MSDSGNFSEKLVYKCRSFTEAEVWLDGEDLDDRPQVIVNFRKALDNTWKPAFSYELVYDGVDAESMQEIIKLSKLHALKLGEFYHDLSGAVTT